MKVLKAVVAACVLLLLMLSGLWGYSRLQNRVVVVNNSGKEASFVKIDVGGESIDFGPIPVGRTVSLPFTIRSDSGFILSGRLASGNSLSFMDGYVTGGMWGHEAVFTIHPADEFPSSPARVTLKQNY